MIEKNKEGEPVIRRLPPCAVKGCKEDGRFFVKQDILCGKHCTQLALASQEAELEQHKRMMESLK
jgi:hypothetical protein